MENMTMVKKWDKNKVKRIIESTPNHANFKISCHLFLKLTFNDFAYVIIYCLLF